MPEKTLKNVHQKVEFDILSLEDPHHTDVKALGGISGAGPSLSKKNAFI